MVRLQVGSGSTCWHVWTDVREKIAMRHGELDLLHSTGIAQQWVSWSFGVRLEHFCGKMGNFTRASRRASEVSSLFFNRPEPGGAPAVR
jgi:hypothetical protein